MKWYDLILLLGLVGCGSLQKAAIRSSAPVFENSSYDLLKEGNWEFFRTSTPGNLKFMELLWEQDKTNLRLLGVLVKGYAGYAFTVPETLAFGDSLAQIDDSIHKKDAIYFYTRALDYGLYYLDQKGISSSDLLGDETKLSKKLEKKLDEDDVMALLYTAQSWGSLINLQKDNVALVSQIPKVKVLFDHVCGIQPDIDENVCDIFYAQYESSRPKMLGGNPEKGEKLYLEAMKKHPKNLLIRMSYVQYFILPAYLEDKYKTESKILSEEFAKWEDMNRDELANKSPYRMHRSLNLYNAISKKRFELLEKYKSKYF